MKIIFFGQDDFAALHLKLLLSAKHEVICAVTGPDKPQGRGMKITVSPIKQIALERELPCLQPASLKDKFIVEKLKSYEADIFIVVAYGRLLTQEILGLPKMICINVHGSLLPKYRGAAPINWAILNGDKETGVTLQKMALKLDAGDIIAQEVMAIGPDEDAAQLRERMAMSGAKLLLDVLSRHPLGQFPLLPQNEDQVSQAPKLTKDMAAIDWHKEARVIKNQVRGLQPWPGASTTFQGKLLKIKSCRISAENEGQHAPGSVVNVDKNGIHVACAEGVLVLTEVQPEAGRVMPAAGFAAGHKISTGIALGI